jgi:hypothetical protein
LIDGFEELDAAVTGSLDSTIKPLMVLEDIETGSLRVWLKTILEKVDDKGLAEGEWKKAIGPALVDAKYAAIEWLDKDKKDATESADAFREGCARSRRRLTCARWRITSRSMRQS